LREGKHERPHGYVGIALENRLGTGADFLRRSGPLELFCKRREKLRKPALMAASISADFSDAILQELANAMLDLIADLADNLERLIGWIVDFPVLDSADDVWACFLTIERDRLVGV
jgi:hypothetical protein